MSDTKQKIFDASLDLFAKNGYRTTSIRDIAEKVGIRESSIYNHYPSKEAILDDILATFTQDNKLAFPEEETLEDCMMQTTVEEYWCLGQDRFHDFIGTPRVEKTFRILMSIHFYNENAKATLFGLLRWYINQVKILLDRMIEKRLIKQIDTEIAATNYVYMILVFLLEYCASNSDKTHRASVKKRVDEHIKFFFSNLIRS